MSTENQSEEIPTPSRESAEEVLKTASKLAELAFPDNPQVSVSTIGTIIQYHEAKRQGYVAGYLAGSQFNQSLPLSKEEVESSNDIFDRFFDFKVVKAKEYSESELRADIITAIEHAQEVGMSEEQKNELRAQGWDAGQIREEYDLHVERLGNDSNWGVEVPPTKETYLSSFLPKKP